MRTHLIVIGLLGSLALGGCGSDRTEEPAAASEAQDPGLALSDSGTSAFLAQGDPAVLAALCEDHCGPLTLDGISLCESTATCDANVAEARARVDSLVAGATAEGLDIEAAAGFQGRLADADLAREAYEANDPCRGASVGTDLSQACFEGVSNYLLAVQMIGFELELRS